jgi:hypothetical protein
VLRACFWLGEREYRGLVLAFRLAAPTLTLSRAQGPPRRGGADRALIARPVSPAVGVSAIWYANRLLTTPIGTRGQHRFMVEREAPGVDWIVALLE